MSNSYASRGYQQSPVRRSPPSSGNHSAVDVEKLNLARTPGTQLGGAYAGSGASSHSSPFHLDNSPLAWNSTAYAGDDDDDYDEFIRRSSGCPCNARGCCNIGTLVFLASTLLMLFAGYPIMYHVLKTPESKKGGFNLGGTNMSGQIPAFAASMHGLIDPDTPQDALTRKSLEGEDMVLVFSDEFNTDGRSFYPGDDPFWEAQDLWAHGTGDYEWYDPAAVTTANGNLVITATEHESHNLNFRSGHLSSWNKMCFTGGYVEVRVQLPGSSKVAAWWPAAWTMGNLGRANYGATTEGTWPYTYEACDIGTLPNQTYPDQSGPEQALISGKNVFNTKYGSDSLSFLPGQRLSSCTCPGDDHPGPVLSDGSYAGRSAPEIDIIEAQVSGGRGHVSQSGQFAPFNAWYQLLNGSGPVNDTMEFYGKSTLLNSYQGNVLQQSASAVTETPQNAYQHSGAEFAEYGFEYRPGYDNSYITWVSGGEPAWKITDRALQADTRAEISWRPVPLEPMYVILNLALSAGFGDIDWDNIEFPGIMLVDYVRIWQVKGKENIGCDPPDFPTKDYIEKHAEAYFNPNLTLWGVDAGADAGTRGSGYEQDWPRNRLYDGACDRPAIKHYGRN